MRTNSERRPWLAALLGSVAWVSAAGAAPWIENARIVPRTLAGGLRATVDELARGEEAWVAYTVPMLPGDHRLCCHDGRDPDTPAACRLDERGFSFSNPGGHAPRPESGGGELWVLLRVGDRRLRQVRSFGGHCAIDAGGALVHVLDGIDPPQSVDLLRSSILDPDRADLRDGALAALSFHAAESAGRALLGLAASESPAEVRAKAAFWLGVTRGTESLERLGAMARGDESREVREQAVFAISASDAPGSEALLIELARRDPDPATRSTALFWLGQEAGERVADTLREAVDDDPDIAVKEQAVFALSQLPPERGVPLLIDLARSSKRHPAVRRTAMFWLGQSGDPRALALFEEILAAPGAP